MAKQFTSKVLTNAVPIQFDLDGKEYTFTPPKKTTGLLALLVSDTNAATKDLDRMSKILNWFSQYLNRDHNEKHNSFVEDCQACDIEQRLKDDEDPLAIETVFDAAMWLMGESANRPTT